MTSCLICISREAHSQSRNAVSTLILLSNDIWKRVTAGETAFSPDHATCNTCSAGSWIPWQACKHTWRLLPYKTCKGLDRPWGFQEVEAPRFQDNRLMKVVKLSALRTGRLYTQGNIPATIGNRTRAFPACSAVKLKVNLSPERATKSQEGGVEV